jgi:hypothetical protein
MPERMRLIRNRAEVIFGEEHPVLVSAVKPSLGALETAIPSELRQRYFELAERELVAERKISSA